MAQEIQIPDLIKLSMAVDDTQAYFMALAKLHDGEITLTFRNEAPFVTIFLGKGPDAPIGFGSSVAGAILDSMPKAKREGG